MSETEPDIAGISRLRKWIIWAAVVGTALWAGYFFVFLIYQSLVGSTTSENWFIKMIQDHPAATIGVAMSAISAFCLVSILEISRGAIEFEALGFKFRGASGPVILWVFCFLVMIFGVWLLWDKSNMTSKVSESFKTNAAAYVQLLPEKARGRTQIIEDCFDGQFAHGAEPGRWA